MAKKAKKGGGGSTQLTIRCAACREPVLLYRKDGAGGLRRMYLDRILEPPELAAWLDAYTSKADVPNLVCPACGQVLAVPMVHGARLALRVITGRLVKQKGNDDWPPADKSADNE